MDLGSVKVCLAEQVPVTLKVEQDGGITKLSNSFTITVEVDIKSTTAPSGDKNTAGKLLRRKVLFEKLMSDVQNKQLECLMIMSRRENNPSGWSVRPFVYYLDLYIFKSSGGLRLKEILEEENGYLQVEIFPDRKDSFSLPPFKTRVMEPKHGGCQIECQNTDDNPMLESLANSQHFSRFVKGKMNLILTTTSYCPDPAEREKLAVYKRMLEQELGTDAVIVPENGEEVKCHQSILSAHSDVLQTMFATDMQEAKTRRIEMPDMSEKSVRAFLAYLYHWDKSVAYEDYSVAVELLKAGHKYNIRFLENAMHSLLMQDGHEFVYYLDTSMKLFLFIHNFGVEWEPLKKKAVMLIKSNTQDLKNSPTVQQLFHENPDAAITFCQYALSVVL